MSNAANAASKSLNTNEEVNTMTAQELRFFAQVARNVERNHAERAPLNAARTEAALPVLRELLAEMYG